MVPWKSRKRQTAYSRVLRQISEHDAVWAAEKVVGTAWMATLDESEEQAATAPGLLPEQHAALRQFAEHERTRWEQARRIRTLEILSDRDRLTAAEPPTTRDYEHPSG
ncbi:hypothetical protein ABH926_006837 [Catenulispora sp. GP43]|uniref:hypothetical protein n=1 Tax=Catenulispora sp. GP43 TaxID=3156263 RepID=UPI0035120028